MDKYNHTKIWPININCPLYLITMSVGLLNLALNLYDYRTSQLCLIIPSAFMLGHTVLVFIVFSFPISTRYMVPYICGINIFGGFIIGSGAVISVLKDATIFDELIPTNLSADICGFFLLPVLYFAVGVSIVHQQFYGLNIPPSLTGMSLLKTG
ncbi:uncharacterized protein LOC110849925 [Folsomia candida]|uniref:Uncharacterized protein n=1 Tax=Folsomia candida TaxID=158441 RepID=A0A226E9N2_FOLCA|nr:uncharacterized protein LOC110849925 [Folsomia candida]OXA54253.1 hypothetical protein Fcan01_11879 [Folsomia candida]